MSKILFIIDHLGCGGAERITLQLAEYLAKQDHIIYLAVLNGQRNHYHCSSLVHYMDLQIAESFAYGKMWKNKMLTLAEQDKISQLLNHNFDLIVTGYNNGHWLTPYLKGNVWHWIHGDLLEVRKFNNRLKQLKEHLRFFKNKRKFSKLFHNRNLITVNRDLENKARAYSNPNSIKTIANGVNIPSKYLNRYPTTEKKWDVVFVGRLVPIKQVDHAITAFSMSNTNGRMAIVGDGTERQKLEELTKELKIADRVDFLGWIEEPYQVMLQSRCLVLSSLYEGSPVILAESILLDVPVVTYNSSHGIEDLFCANIIKDILVNKQNIQDLAFSLSKCIQKPYVHPQICKNKVSIKNMADQFISLI
ncbi:MULTISPECIES: glycosyltransferase [Acinetobacter]|uniref:glycosyltransferase n=1 Tax=Acinetobacter TaxID=469 RepID=UPI0015D1CBD6|nr:MULTISPECIES: glycosyltransferase [Acinetobacter]MDM1755031.1 glycosyltransferase [Acinetobacter towneri]UUS57070.1 glycosyltransferase [Acinetobacter sp. YH16040_T]